MAAAAVTAAKSGGQLFLAGKPGFMETVMADDPATRHPLATWMRARGKERRERIWFRDAESWLMVAWFIQEDLSRPVIDSAAGAVDGLAWADLGEDIER